MKLGLIVLAALGVACASGSRWAVEPESDGLARPGVCSAETLRNLDLPIGTVRVVRQTQVQVPGRAVVGGEPFPCEELERSACLVRAEQYAQRRAWQLGLSMRLLPAPARPKKIEIQYIEPNDRPHNVPAADVDYEVPWGSDAQKQALQSLRDELDGMGLELDERSEQNLALTISGMSPDSEEARPEPEDVAWLAMPMPQIDRAPQVLRLRLRCKPDAGARARARATSES
jgi:hypothetical protein